MTKEQRTVIEKATLRNQIAVDIQHKVTGTDKDGFLTFEIVYENAPKNFKLVKVIEAYNGAILEDLDYVEPTEPQSE